MDTDDKTKTKLFKQFEIRFNVFLPHAHTKQIM